MPPRTRAKGAPPGGFAQLSAQTRERHPVLSPQLPLQKQEEMPQPNEKTKKLAVTPVVAPALTAEKATQTPKKRPHEDTDDEEPERALKRPNTEPRPPRPHQGTPLFGGRHRSALTPGRFNNRRRPLVRKPLPPNNPLEEEARQLQAALQKPVEVEPEPEPLVVETPTQKQGLVGRMFGSIRKTLFGGAQEETPRNDETATPTPPAGHAPQENPFEAAPIVPRRAAQAARLAKLNNQPREAGPANKPYKQPTVEDAMDSPMQQEHDLQTLEVPGSRKRKLDTATEDRQPKKLMLNADENGNITGAFGLTDEDLEYSDEEEEEEEDTTPQPEQSNKTAVQEKTTSQEKSPLEQTSAQVPKPQPEQPDILKTPGTLGLDNFEPSFTNRGKALRSAMKAKPNTTTKKVGFSSQLTTHHVYGNLGPAGEYKGTLFAYPAPKTPDERDFGNTSPMSLDTPSTTTPRHIDNRGTMKNTNFNQRANRLDAANAASDAWGSLQEKTPVITNKSGHFAVPFVDDESPAPDQPESEEPEEPTPVPSAPKIPHASLPDTDERLNKARQEAQQYKPKQSSRLSNVEPAARSRSSSPAQAAAQVTAINEAEEMRNAAEWAANLDWPELQAYPDEDAEQKMREAEEWAANLDWPEPKTYVEAGLVSPYIDQLLTEKWTDEDERLTHEFWDKEFTEVNDMMNAAKAAGKKLELVYEED